MTERAILHIDMNNFYASVECMLNPELKPFPIAVCGSQEERHGIVLAKNYAAKAKGVSTGDDDFYKKVTDILNAVIGHPELLDEVEPKDTYESEYEVTSKANQVNHMLTSPGVNFESAVEDILNLASLKYDNCEYDITEELTETIKQDYIGRQRLDDVDTELIERTVSHLTVNNQGKIAIHFINGATVKTEGET